MSDVRTSIHAAVWGADWTPDGMGRTLAEASEIGYDFVVVPLRRFTDIQPEPLARAFERNGLRPLNTCGVSPQLDVGHEDAQVRRLGMDHLRQAIRLARDMGSTQIGGVLYGPIHKAAEPASRDAFMRAAESIRAVADDAASAGVRLAMEVVNRYETPLLHNVARGLDFIDAVSHPNVCLHLDTFHLSIDEASPAAAIARAVPRMGYFELDQSHRGDAVDGSLDLVAWCRMAAAAGYSGIVGVEAFSRQLLAPDHANALAVWETRFDDSKRVAANFMNVIRQGFGT